jgi:hypothetical protein
MIDSGNVLLLRPVQPNTGFSLPRVRAPLGAGQQSSSLIVASIYLLPAPVDADFVHFFDSEVRPAQMAAGATALVSFQTESAENNFPALPVRSGEHAFVWFAAFASTAHHAAYLTKLSGSADWSSRVQPQLARRLLAEQRLLLEPTPRSLLGQAMPPGFELNRTGAASDFDFLEGNWDVVNRRLRQRGIGSTEWIEFSATMRAWLHLGGVANSDEIVFPSQDWAGMTVRAFDVQKRQWSIYWINSRHGVLSPAVRGGFTGDRGEFYGEDDDDGRPVKVRFIWTMLTRDLARWEQAFAYDGGQQWETNWIMEMSRSGATPS